MQVFTTSEGNYKSIIGKYKKSGEIAKISSLIDFEGRKYREITFHKKTFGKIKKHIEGIVFITENGEYVSDERIKKELMYLAYYLEIMLGENSINELKNAMVPELEIEKDLENYEHMNCTLELFKKGNVLGTDNVITIFSKLPDAKRESTKAIDKYLKEIEKINEESFVFNSQKVDELYSSYREVLIKNFQKIRLINSGARFYDEIKREASKRKRNIGFRFNNEKVIKGITKLPYEMDSFRSIVRVYEKVAAMKQEEYLKYLKTIERSNIKDRMSLIR